MHAQFGAAFWSPGWQGGVWNGELPSLPTFEEEWGYTLCLVKTEPKETRLMDIAGVSNCFACHHRAWGPHLTVRPGVVDYEQRLQGWWRPPHKGSVQQGCQ